MPSGGMGSAQTTATPPQPVELKKPPLDKSIRENVGRALYESINASRSDRTGLDQYLQRAQALYEQKLVPRDWPWPNASNVFVPIIPKMVDTLAAQLSGIIFAPRFYLVNANTPDASKFQAEVERYYNTELWRHRWDEKHYEMVHQSLIDGTAIMEVLWKRSHAQRTVVIVEPMTDPETGFKVLDLKTGQQKIKHTTQKVDVVEYDDVELSVTRLEDFMVIPSWQYGIEEAMAVAIKLWLDENTLNEMVEAGVLWGDEVEASLAYVRGGESERGRDIQGVSAVDIGGKIAVTGAEQGSPQSDVPQMRGPIQVWRVHSRQFDLDGDGSPEENVFWVAENNEHLLGYDTYRYWHGKRPFVACTPMARPGLFYGFGVPERLDSIQTEANANHNQRIDAINLALSPPLLIKTGTLARLAEHTYHPAAQWEVDDPGDVLPLPFRDVPQSTWLEESSLTAMAEGLIGLSDPMTGVVGKGGRRTKAEVQAAQNSAGVRINLMAARIRQTSRDIFWQIHQLKLQYGPDEQEINTYQGGQPLKLIISKEKLAQDYSLDIVGAGGPLDKKARLDEMMFLYNLLMQNPDVVGDPIHRYRVTRMLLEQFELPDVTSLIGTEEEVMQKMQQMMQQQQMMGGGMNGQPNGQPGGQGAMGQPGAPPGMGPAGKTGPGPRPPGA